MSFRVVLGNFHVYHSVHRDNGVAGFRHTTTQLEQVVEPVDVTGRSGDMPRGPRRAVKQYAIALRQHDQMSSSSSSCKGCFQCGLIQKLCKRCTLHRERNFRSKF